ncbi:LLM class flavin-dependent oxidoreductase [Alkalihalobacterium chitinilyticum]|uniref:LLM class flavin-dependent oxidoreductase n=1 Tax=Alkalihalobacterium chitinilyticum TaxID=2980103 RepID=A0ABT5VDW6_9BACI|nr:LLM class flavin-dependent oxidoreductase [Alkalihalobacterium chitinilyticum]MDE5413326.1 LLM class flavin-dependent oxidoreductase [Alkalihalobacterium chitinilyticum]
MNLSILDQAPISSGLTASEALQASIKLAQAGEGFGYKRYWIAEHHDFSGLSCSAPEVMLAAIGANTSNIRMGAGAILLPHYKPYKVAEVFNMLATLYPGRIDLGIGRAPGGSAEVTMALSNNFLQQVYKLPESVQELFEFLYRDFPDDHMYANISAAPLPNTPPQPWILGTSGKSAKLAAEQGAAYAFGHFMSDKEGPEIVKSYVDHFEPRRTLKKPKTIIAVSVVCAATTAKAEELATSSLLWKIQLGKGEGTLGVPSIEEARNYIYTNEEMTAIEKMKQKMIIGNPQYVKEQLLELQSIYCADEIMMVTITHSYEDRIRSYELIANEW